MSYATTQINLESLILKQANIRAVRQSCTDHLGRTESWYEPMFNDIVLVDVPVNAEGDGDPREQYGFDFDERIDLEVNNYDLNGHTFSARVTRFAQVQQYPRIVRLYISIESDV